MPSNRNSAGLPSSVIITEVGILRLGGIACDLMQFVVQFKCLYVTVCQFPSAANQFMTERRVPYNDLRVTDLETAIVEGAYLQVVKRQQYRLT